MGQGERVATEGVVGVFGQEDGGGKELCDVSLVFDSFVFGLRPILCFLDLNIKVPNFEILIFFSFFKLINIKERKSSTRFSEICFENPICI